MFRTFTLLLGIVIGILIAPDKGAVTRKRLTELFTGSIDEKEKPLLGEA